MTDDLVEKVMEDRDIGSLIEAIAAKWRHMFPDGRRKLNAKFESQIREIVREEIEADRERRWQESGE